MNNLSLHYSISAWHRQEDALQSRTIHDRYDSTSRTEEEEKEEDGKRSKATLPASHNLPNVGGVFAGRIVTRSPVQVFTVRQVRRMTKDVGTGHVTGSHDGELFQLNEKWAGEEESNGQF